MSTTTKAKPAPNGAPGASAPPEANYRVNPEVEEKIDAYIKENPKHWNYLQGMPPDFHARWSRSKAGHTARGAIHRPGAAGGFKIQSHACTNRLSIGTDTGEQ